MDHARPERLRDLVLALLPTYPDVEVYTDVRAVYEVPEGAVMILAPRAEDADWLNQQRPVFARRKLRVILWCDAETSIALAQKAVDFFDWISHRHECPPGVPMHAVYGIRAALCARAPGIGWRGDNLEACFRVALPGRRLVYLNARLPREELVQAIGRAGRAWLVLHDDNGDGYEVDLRVNEILGALRIKTRVIYSRYMLFSSTWDIDACCQELVEARAALAASGARAPGRLAALTGFEREAIHLVEYGLRRGVPDTSIEESMRNAVDPGAAAVRLLRSVIPPAFAFGRALTWRDFPGRNVMVKGQPFDRKPLGWVAFFAAKDAIGRGDVADAQYWRSLASLYAAGDRSIDYANVLRLDALDWARAGSFGHAVQALHKALRIAKIRLGDDDPFLGGLYGDLAEILAQKGDFDEALRLAELAFQLERSVPSLSSPYTSRAYKRIGSIQSLRDATTRAAPPTP